MPNLLERFKNAWSAFRGRSPTRVDAGGYGYSYNPGRIRLQTTSLQKMINAIYVQIAVDCSSIDIKHVRLDDEGRYKETIDSYLNRALTKEANLDQTGRDLIRGAVLTMLDEGVVALLPVTATEDPNTTDSYDVEEIRSGTILEWYPYHVLVRVYNPNTGEKTELLVEKRYTVIVENPFYGIMNEPNSVGQRLLRVIRQLESLNDEVALNKLDIIVQLPYSLNSPAKRELAEDRRKQIEAQLTTGQFGIAYIDSTEKIIQLNRSLENNLWEQAKDLQEQLYNQLGFSKSIFDGTADEKTMLNYNNRTIEPIMSALVENIERKWISRTAQTQKQAIRFFRDPFKLVPVAQLAEIADKFTRNEIMTSNETRAIIGMKPVDDPKANELRNANLNHPDEGEEASGVTDEMEEV